MSEAKAPAAPAAAPIAQNPKPAQASAPAVPDFKGTKHRVPVDGKEIEVDYDELRRGYTHNQAANRRMQEAAEIKKQAAQEKAYAEQVLKSFDDPQEGLKFLVSKMGKEKARAAFENFLIDEMAYEQLPESEKRARELERRAKQLEDELKKEREGKATERQQQIAAKAHADIDAEVSAAFEKLGRKPTPRMVLRVVDEMILRGSVMNEKIPAEKAFQYTQEAIWGDIAEYLEHTPVEDAIKRLPKPFLDALQKHQVNQVLDTKQQRRVPAERQPSKDKEKSKGIDDWFKDKERQLQRKRG